MTNRPAKPRGRLRRWLTSPVGILVLVAFFCHGVLLLTDYKIWDGQLIALCQRTGWYDGYWRHYHEAGIPHHYLVHRLFGFSEHSVWLYKVTSFGAYLGTACAFFKVLQRSGFLRTPEALLAGVFMLVFPGMMTLGEAALTSYVLGLFLFSIACLLAVSSELVDRTRHVALRLGAIVSFLLGLTYYGLVPFYLVFYLFFVGFLWRRSAPCTLAQFATTLARRFDYLVLPIVFWWLKGKLAPTSGYYAGYNAPVFDLMKWVFFLRTFFENYLLIHLQQLPLNPFVFIAAASAGWWLSRSWFPPSPKSWKSVAILAVQGCFAALMGALPYIAVGRPFYAFGYVSNSNLLVPIGASLVLVAFIGAARLLVPGDRKGVLANCIIAYIVLSCASIWSTNYLHWQALAAKEESLAIKLRRNPIVKDATVLFVVDRFVIPKTDIYPVAICTAQHQAALGKRSVFAINLPEQVLGRLTRRVDRQSLEDARKETQIPFFFTDANLDGPQALIVVSRGGNSDSSLEIGLRDLYLRRLPFASAEEHSRFSESLVEAFATALP